MYWFLYYNFYGLFKNKNKQNDLTFTLEITLRCLKYKYKVTTVHFLTSSTPNNEPKSNRSHHKSIFNTTFLVLDIIIIIFYHTSFSNYGNGRHLGHFRPQDLYNVQNRYMQIFYKSNFTVLYVQIQIKPPKISKVWTLSDSSNLEWFLKKNWSTIHFQETSKITVSRYSWQLKHKF